MITANLRLVQDLQDLTEFLVITTPQEWIEHALTQLPTLLIDHAHCEKKAASAALQLIYRYPRKKNLLRKMTRLAREELLHFDQVCKLIEKRSITYDYLSASSYAANLHRLIDKNEPNYLIDSLIVGALVEARSCERFAALIPYLDDELAGFYQSLLKSEARHYQDYLHLAKAEAIELGKLTPDAFWQRVDVFKAKENALILTPDKHFRFHSGPPSP